MKSNKIISPLFAYDIPVTRNEMSNGWNHKEEFYQLIKHTGVIMKTLFFISLLLLCCTFVPTESVAQNNVTIRVVDQDGVSITGSRVWFTNANVTNWQAVYNDETASLTLGVSYIFDIVPGLPHAEYDEGSVGVICKIDNQGIKTCGRDYPDQLQRRVVQSYNGETELLFEWRRNPVTITLVDQNESFIAGSKYNITRGNGSGIISDRHTTTLLLPITDGSVYSAMSGEIVNNGGYFIDILPGYNDTIGTYNLYRRESFPVNLTTTAVSFEWRVMECPVQVVETSGSLLDNFSLAFGLYGNAGTALPGTMLHLPITDETVYPSMGGNFLSGFPVTFTLNGILTGTETFEVANTLEFSPAFVTINNNQYGLRCMQPSYSIHGQVSVACSGTGCNNDDEDDEHDEENQENRCDSIIQSGLFGVMIEVVNSSSGNVVGTATTDLNGNYDFTDLDGGNYLVVIHSPLGYEVPSAETVISLCCNTDATVNFNLTCSNTTGSPRSIGFWKHQFSVATGGKGSAQVTAETLCNLLNAIQQHFNEHTTNPVEVYQPPASNSCADKLNTGNLILNSKGSVPKTVKARQQLFALLLNVAAGFLHQARIISEDGATVAQAISYCDQLLDDPHGNHELAKKLAEKINDGETVESGRIPLSTQDIRYKTGIRENHLATSVQLFENYPNPFNPSTNIVFELPNSMFVTLKVYDVLGREVATLAENELYESGTHEIEFNASHLTSGLYFYRLSALGGDGTLFNTLKRMTLLK